MYILAAYLTYLAVTLAATVWVGLALRRNGRILLTNAFHGDAELADSVNYLFLVGFYLVTIGFVALALPSHAELGNVRQAVELVCDKIGAALLVLGLLHFSNLYLFNRLRRRGRDRERLEYRRTEPASFGRVLD